MNQESDVIGDESVPAQETRGLVDIHCHCLPGIDDGPRDLEESLQLCQALVEDGFETVVASPHQMGRYQGQNTRALILEVLDQLRAAIEEKGIPLEVLPGADVRIDAQLEALITSGDVLTIDDARQYLLLELPHSFFVEPAQVIDSLGRCGIRTVLTHPERYRYLAGALEPVEAWQAQGAVIQVTAGSLLGDFGRTAFAYGWRLVHAGLVDVIATDAHDPQQRRPRMQEAMARLTFEVGAAETNRICRTNPRRILRGEKILSRHGANP